MPGSVGKSIPCEPDILQDYTKNDCLIVPVNLGQVWVLRRPIQEVIVIQIADDVFRHWF